jgi:hypothetical protein
MTSKKKVLIYGLMIALLIIGSTPIITADMIDIDPYNKNVGISYKLAGIDDFNDYVFFVYQLSYSKGVGIWARYQIIQPGDSFFFINNDGYIYAIPVDQFNESALQKTVNKINIEIKNYFQNTTNRTEINTFFTDIENYFNATIKAPRMHADLAESYKVSKNDPLTSVQIILTISSLKKDAFMLQASKILYTFTDGSTEEKNFVTEPVTGKISISEKSFPPYSKITLLQYWFLSLPILAIIGISFVFILRKKGEKQ